MRTNTLSFDPEQTASLSAGERHALYDAMHLASETLHGVMIQPRCRDDGDLNGAGGLIAGMMEFFNRCISALVETETQRKEVDPYENERRLQIILFHQARMCDDIADLAAMASRFVVDQLAVERDARHSGKQDAK